MNRAWKWVLLTWAYAAIGTAIWFSRVAAHEHHHEGDVKPLPVVVVIEPDPIPTLADLPPTVLPPRAPGQTDIQRLGEIFAFDKRFSRHGRESCISCHQPQTGFAGPIPGVMPGDEPGRGGRRTAPGLRYIEFSPVGPCLIGGQYVGGRTWNGAADIVRNLGAPFDPNEMANVGKITAALPRHGYSPEIARKLRRTTGETRRLFIAVFSELNALSDEQLYLHFIDAITAWLQSRQMNPFDSEYDRFVAGDKHAMSESAQRGMDLFFGRAGCSECHSSKGLETLAMPNPKGHDLLSMFCYTNIGQPKNPKNPFYGQTDCASNPNGCNAAGVDFIDFGLGNNPFASTPLPNATPPIPSVKFFNVVPGDIPENNGLFKAPILRNVALKVSFGHNGAFEDLDEFIRHDSDRDIAVNAAGKRQSFDQRVGPPPGFTRLFPPAEVVENMVNVAGKRIGTGNPDDNATSGEIGNLNLSREDRHDLVHFLRACTDADLVQFLPRCEE